MSPSAEVKNSTRRLLCPTGFWTGVWGLFAQASCYRRNMATDNQESDPLLAATDGSGINYAREFENKPYRLDP
jgi:hypothetical protein